MPHASIEKLSRRQKLFDELSGGSERRDRVDQSCDRADPGRLGATESVVPAIMVRTAVGHAVRDVVRLPDPIATWIIRLRAPLAHSQRQSERQNADADSQRGDTAAGGHGTTSSACSPAGASQAFRRVWYWA
jgi:hypothetical protein